MKDFFVAEDMRKIRGELAGILDKSLTSTVSSLKLEIDEEIKQELKESVAVLILNEAVNDMPIIPYIAVWEDGSEEIRHIYMSPKIEDLLGYSPDQLKKIGFRNIAGGNILSFFREQDHVEEKLTPTDEAIEKRKKGFIGTRVWEGFYQVLKKDGDKIWVIDRATITKYRNTKKDNVICVSGGVLLDTTDILDKKT